MEIVISIIIGIIIGAVATCMIFGAFSAGSLRVDHSIPEDEPYLFLELTRNVSTILRKKFVVLKVRAEDFIPHK